MPLAVIAQPTGDGHRHTQEIPVTKRIYFLSIAAVCCTGAGFMQFGVNQLDAATAHQCRTHDWPAHQHQNHLDFCREYGYEVGQTN